MNKKLTLCLLAFNLFTDVLFAQSTFDGQVKKMSDTIAARILRAGKRRVAVSNFTDLQGNTTELGKYIAEAFSIELSNGNLEVVDRSRIKELLQELKMTEEKLTTPANALKLGEMAGIEYIITGTTTPLDNTVDITVKALDIQKGISVGGQRGSVPRTDAINNLMRSTVGNGDQTAANVNAAHQVDTRSKSPSDDLFEAKVSDLRPVDYISISTFNSKLYAGQVCFENQTGYDLMFSAKMFGTGGVEYFEGRHLITLPKGGRNCTGQIVVNYEHLGAESAEINFLFKTLEAEQPKSGYFKILVEKGKVKSVVLTKSNLLLR
jgi:TolB-like protein